HSHFDEMIQIAPGMVGTFVVHPKVPVGPRVDRDFVLMTHEWRLHVGARRPNPLEMTDWNLLTFNSKAFPATQPMLMKTGERIRPRSAHFPQTTVLVPVGTTRVIEFTPTEPG